MSFTNSNWKKNKKEQRQQLERQTEMIATLRAQVEQMQNNATTDLATRAEQDLSIHNKNTDINLLKIESERVTEMAEMFKSKAPKACEDLKNIYYSMILLLY